MEHKFQKLGNAQSVLLWLKLNEVLLDLNIVNQ